MGLLDDVPLRRGESRLWAGKPEPGPFYAAQARTALLGVALFLAVLAGVVWLQRSSWSSPSRTLLTVLSFPLFAIALLTLVAPVFSVKAYRITEYLLTDQRILRVEGIRKPAVKELALSDVTGVALEKGFSDRLWGTGTLRFAIDPGRAAQVPYCVFLAIARPESVLAEVERRLPRGRG